MAEITEAATTAAAADSNAGNPGSEPEFDPKLMRKTKPGIKRLILSLSVLFSFLVGLPFLLKSIEIYRSPLPFHEIDTFSAAVESNPLLFPFRFHAIFVNFSVATSANHLGFSLQNHIAGLTSRNPPLCGTCHSHNNIFVSVTLDESSSPNSHCENNHDTISMWQCGGMENLEFGNDVAIDEHLKSLLSSDERKVYSVVVINREEEEEEELRAVVGKYRHAWIIGRILGKEEKVLERVAEIFVKVFANGGVEEGSIHGEFMPVGADGRLVLSFNLLNADPDDWVYEWDFQEMDEVLLAPVVEALRPVADVSVESQVLYHTPKSSFSYWDDEQESYIFGTKDLPFFVNSNEWHLDTSTAAGGRSKVLQFVVYIPSSSECPLLLQLPDGDISMTNGFISPMWGGVVVLNPPACTMGSENVLPLRHRISPEDTKKVFEVLMGQLRQLFGLKSDSTFISASGSSLLLASDKGFTEWELDALSRQHTCFNLLQCGTTLGSLSRLVQSLPRMIIKEEIGKQVKFSLEAAKLTFGNASRGTYDASAVSSRQARSLAEDAFFHPSIMSVSYYSFEHCFAVYSPFFLPVSLHMVLAVLKEWKRYRSESRKYTAWKAKQ